MKINYPILLSVLSLVLLTAASHGEEVALYDNTHIEAKPPRGLEHLPPPFLDSSDEDTAIQFFTGENDNVSSVSVSLLRTGQPGGTIQLEIWTTGADNRPDSLVGTLGSIEVNTLSTWISGMGAPGKDPVPPPIQVKGSVTGLQPMTRYFLVLRNDEAVTIKGPGQTIHVIPLFQPNPGTPHPSSGDPLVELIFRENEDGGWKKLAPDLGIPVPGWQHARIAAACPQPEIPEEITADIEPAVAITWDSHAGKTYEIRSSTDLKNWTVEVSALQGTGERLRQFFIRSDSEIYYRVVETQ